MPNSEDYWRNARRCLDRATKCDMPRTKAYWERMVERWTEYAEQAELIEQRQNGHQMSSQ